MGGVSHAAKHDATQPGKVAMGRRPLLHPITGILVPVLGDRRGKAYTDKKLPTKNLFISSEILIALGVSSNKKQEATPTSTSSSSRTLTP